MGKRFTYSLISLIAAFCLLPTAVFADTKPYFKVFGGDVFAGGWIDSNSGDCTTSDANYQAPTYSPLTNQFAGGILAFANSTRHGASTNFGAFAQGLIEGNNASQYGFYAGASGTSALSFSNTNNVSADYWGGYWAGATPQVHCIPDYYDTKQSSPADLGTAANVDLASLASGQYKVVPAGASINISSSATSIARGKTVTLFVNGNAYIKSNITYQSGYTYSDVPKLAIIAKGEIYIDPSVTQVDGLYIAQPSSGATGGDIWTCHDASNSSPDGSYLRANCATKLTINGAIIAKQVYLMRVKGDLASAGANEVASSANIAEVINYIPAMVVGGPFFSSGSGSDIDSLISLPPVF